MNIEVKQVSRRFGETQALRKVDLTVSKGVKVLAMIGPSGGGKSTLLRLLGGLDVPDSGEIYFDSTLLDRQEDPLRSHRRRNGFLFQSFNLFPHLSALKNVTLPLLQVHGKSETEAREIAMEAVERFHLEDHVEKYPCQLSGGQQQRVGLARAIAHQPQLLILDEPTSALDPEMTAEVLEVIEELCEAGQEIVLSTHEMGFARAVADEIVFLADGEIVEVAAPEKIFGEPDHDSVKRFLSRVMRY